MENRLPFVLVIATVAINNVALLRLSDYRLTKIWWIVFVANVLIGIFGFFKVVQGL